jgi:transposase
MSEVVTTPSPQPIRRSRAAVREEWMDRLARFPASGLTVAQFCAIEAVCVPSFYSWKRRLAAELGAAASPQDSCVAQDVPLLPVRLSISSPSVDLVLTTGIIVRIPTGCDLNWVRTLVSALGGKPC